MKPLMLITGGSRGIGRACAEFFTTTYTVVTVARTGGVTERGDLTDGVFVQALIAKYPVVDVLINNAGGSLKRLRPTAMLNFVAAGILLEHYCTTMQGGHIITISSNAAYGAEAYNCGYSEMPMQRIAYCAAKRAVKFLSNALSRAHPTVKITSLEPGRVGGKSAVQYKDIPRIIQWVLEQNFQVNTLNFVPKP